MLSYPGQYIKKCRSSSIQPLLQTRHILPSTGIGAPLFSYFPVWIRKLCTPRRNFVILILCAGFLIVLRQSSNWQSNLTSLCVNFSLEHSEVLFPAFSQFRMQSFLSCFFMNERAFLMVVGLMYCLQSAFVLLRHYLIHQKIGCDFLRDEMLPLTED